MKVACAGLIVFVLVAVVLTAAERSYEGSRGRTVEERNYGLFRHMGPDDTIVNLPGGEDHRSGYRLRKMRNRNVAKSGLNEIRKRRSVHLPLDYDDDDQF